MPWFLIFIDSSLFPTIQPHDSIQPCILIWAKPDQYRKYVAEICYKKLKDIYNNSGILTEKLLLCEDCSHFICEAPTNLGRTNWLIANHPNQKCILSTILLIATMEIFLTLDSRYSVDIIDSPLPSTSFTLCQPIDLLPTQPTDHTLHLGLALPQLSLAPTTTPPPTLCTPPSVRPRFKALLCQQC